MANRAVEILVHIKDEALGFFGRLGEAVKGVKEHVFSLGGAIEGFVTGKVVEGIAHLVEMFAETEMTITRLNAALQISGRYTREGSEEIQKMANTMQTLTTVSRQAALEVSATVGALARELTPTQLAQVQKAAIGLSETFGISLERASSLIGRTLEGSFNALHRYGIEVDMSANQQTRFAEVMGKMGPLFQISVEAADTLAGRIEQAKNQFHELERTLGELIAKFLGVDSKAKSLTERFREFNQEMREHGGDILDKADLWIERFVLFGDTVRAVFELVRSLVGALIDSTDAVYVFGQFLREMWKGVDPEVALDHAIISLRNIWGGMKDDMQPFIDAWDKVSATWDRIQSHDDPNHQKDAHNKFKLQPIGAQERPGIGNVGGAEFDTSAAIAHETAVVKDLIESQKLLNQERLAGRGHDAAYVLEHGRVILSLMDERHTIGLLLEREDLQFKQRTALKALHVEVNNSLRHLTNEGLDNAKEKTKELTAAEASLDAEYKAGLITQGQFLARRADIRKALEDEILIIKAMILAQQFSNTEMAEALELLKKLTDALTKAGGAAKNLGAQLREALGAGTLEPMQEAAKKLADLAGDWEDAWTRAAGNAAMTNERFGRAIGRAIQQTAKQEEGMAIAEALKFTAHGIFDVFFNPGKAAADFAAAAEMAAAAAAFALVAGGGGNSGVLGGGGAAGASNAMSAVQNMAGNITIVVPTAISTDPAFVDWLVGTIEQATGKRITVQPG